MSLVCGIKLHRISALLVSAVLSRPAVSLCLPNRQQTHFPLSPSLLTHPTLCSLNTVTLLQHTFRRLPQINFPLSLSLLSHHPLCSLNTVTLLQHTVRRLPQIHFPLSLSLLSHHTLCSLNTVTLLEHTVRRLPQTHFTLSFSCDHKLCLVCCFSGKSLMHRTVPVKCWGKVTAD